MNMIMVNGVTLPSPSVYRIPMQDLDSENTGRNERGVMIRDRLRDGMYKLELEWWAINNSQVQKILSAVKPASLEVKFLSETGHVTKTMYVGDRKVEMVRFMNKEKLMAWNVSFNLIEY